MEAASPSEELVRSYIYIHDVEYQKMEIFINRDEGIENLKSKKAIPLQAWTGPEGSRRLWLPDSESKA